MRTVNRRHTLTRADIDDGVCPLPDELATRLPHPEAVTVVVEHRMHGLDPAGETFTCPLSQEIAWQVSGLVWPPDVHPGTLVIISWQAAKDELHLRTIVLDDPMRVDGVDYFHEYDPRVVTREFDPGRSNRGQVLNVVRRQGRVYEDGSALYPEAGLAAACGLGRGQKGAFLLKNAVDQLLREGYVTRVTGSLNADGYPSYPPVDDEEQAEMLFYAPLVEPAPYPGDFGGDGGGERREHWVKGFVRKLPPGAQATERQQSLHAKAMETAQIDEPLEPGYTFVKKHHRHG
ncbi:hypothetical protein ACTI_62440 [Actinoplanes sp. OR16]|uniref:hypothetical protein n=1 Tax=Actinoplanes sp. OR16 TaxID=946334 RepID=UPI000F6BD19A|nr:hypothetical protein [Actinoplanes sp. OR16]BBH69559.1 hypothetical protein ACTI_62440 [Actinoplanes sp. OR16]